MDMLNAIFAKIKSEHKKDDRDSLYLHSASCLEKDRTRTPHVDNIHLFPSLRIRARQRGRSLCVAVIMISWGTVS